MDNRVYGLLMGGALGDATGSIAELIPGVPVVHPADSRRINVEPGYWQEATGTFLALGDALFQEEPRTAFQQNLCNPAAEFTSEGVMSNLDLGTEEFMAKGKTDHMGSDSGALIRAAAVALYHFEDYTGLLRSSHETCRFTHQNPLCADACKLYAAILDAILHGHSKRDVMDPNSYTNLRFKAHPEVLSVFDRQVTLADLVGGYDALEVLAMALYCFQTTNKYTEGMTLALGSSLKPSHVGAVYGQLAGAYYGLTDIKADWLECLSRPEPLLKFGERILNKINSKL